MSRIGLILIAVSLQPVIAQAQPGLPSATYILIGYKDSRERLRSGTYKATGSKVQFSQPDKRFEGLVEFGGAFDYDAECLRYDRMEPVPPRSPGGHETSRNVWHEGGTYVRTKQRSVRWLLNDIKAAVVGPATVEPPPQLDPIDPRVLGGACSFGVIEGRWFKFDHQLKHFMDSAEGAVVSRLTDGELTISWKDAHSNYALSFVEKSGFVPIRYEVRPLDRPKQYRVYCTAEWELKNGVAVPTHIFVGDNQVVVGGKPTWSSCYDLTLNWDLVNTRLPDDSFAVRGIDLPKGTPIVSNEAGGKAILLGSAGDKDIEHFDDPAVWWHRGAVGWWAAGAVGVAVFFAAVGFIFVQRRRHVSP